MMLTRWQMWKLDFVDNLIDWVKCGVFVIIIFAIAITIVLLTQWIWG